MSLSGITFDDRSELNDESEDFMRDYMLSENTDGHLMAAQPTHQYLVAEVDRIELSPILEEVSSDYFILEEFGDIEKGRIEPDEDSRYVLGYENGVIREEEISWEEAEDIISSVDYSNPSR